MSTTRQQRVQGWLARYPVGHRFIAKEIAKEVNLTGGDVGNILKWQENVRKIDDRLSGNIVQWEKVAA